MELVPRPLGPAHITTSLLSRILLFLYGVWESAQLLRDWSVRMSTNPFLHLHQRNRGHTLSSLWVRRVSQLLQLKVFIAIVLAFYTYYVGFLGKSCAELSSHSQASRLDFPALQSYSDSAMISDYVKICFADSYFFLLAWSK